MSLSVFFELCLFLRLAKKKKTTHKLLNGQNDRVGPRQSLTKALIQNVLGFFLGVGVLVGVSVRQQAPMFVYIGLMRVLLLFAQRAC